MAGGAEDQPRFLGAGYDVDVLPEFFPGREHELAAVDCLTHRAGGYRQDGVGSLPLGQAFESGKGLESELHRLR
jgi:hypothetical protein